MELGGFGEGAGADVCPAIPPPGMLRAPHARSVNMLASKTPKAMFRKNDA